MVVTDKEIDVSQGFYLSDVRHRLEERKEWLWSKLPQGAGVLSWAQECAKYSRLSRLNQKPMVPSRSRRGGWFGETGRATWRCGLVGRVLAWFAPSAWFNPWHYLNPSGPTGEIGGGGPL